MTSPRGPGTCVDGPGLSWAWSPWSPQLRAATWDLRGQEPRPSSAEWSEPGLFLSVQGCIPASGLALRLSPACEAGDEYMRGAAYGHWLCVHGVGLAWVCDREEKPSGHLLKP